MARWIDVQTGAVTEAEAAEPYKCSCKVQFVELGMPHPNAQAVELALR